MTNRPEEIEAKEFAVSWRGYDRDEVRGFLREVAVAVHGIEGDPDRTKADGSKLLDPSLVDWPDQPGRTSTESTSTGPVPETIEVREFSVAWRGYNRDEVRDFLRQIAAEVRRAQPALADDAVPDPAEPPGEEDTPTETEAGEPPGEQDTIDTEAGEPPGEEDTIETEAAEPPGLVEHAADDTAPTSEADAAPTPIDVEVAIVERATDAAMAVRADARRASRAMRNGAHEYADRQQGDAEQLRREAEDYAANVRAAVGRDALAIRTQLTADSNARLQARARPHDTEPETGLAEADDTSGLDTFAGADTNRLRTDVSLARTTISRLQAELDDARAELAAATATVSRSGGPAPAADTSATDELQRRQAAIERQEQRLETQRVEAEAIQANALDQRAEAERLRSDAQRLHDEAAAALTQAHREVAVASTAPTTAGPGAPTGGGRTSPPGEERPRPESEPVERQRPISRTAPPGLGLAPDPATGDDQPSSEDALADMVRDALDTGLGPGD